MEKEVDVVDMYTTISKGLYFLPSSFFLFCFLKLLGSLQGKPFSNGSSHRQS